jgi:hypothetical protein
MLGEATLDALGTFLGEAIRLLIPFAAQQIGRLTCAGPAAPAAAGWKPRIERRPHRGACRAAGRQAADGTRPS